MTDLDGSRLQELLDRQAILDCVHRYCRGIDRHDWDLVLSAFHEDAIERHGEYCGSPRGFVEWIRPQLEQREADHHLIGNHYVELDGDVAYAETYIRGGYKRGDQVILCSARYVARFERRAGEWKIAARDVPIEWTASLPALPPRPGDPKGAFDRSDPSYQRPLSIESHGDWLRSHPPT
jgi:hypothetical protein